MKKIFFKTTLEFINFVKLCRVNKIKFNTPCRANSGFLYLVELPDNINTDEFLIKTGYND